MTRRTIRWSLSVLTVLAATGCSFRGGLDASAPHSSGTAGPGAAVSGHSSRTAGSSESSSPSRSTAAGRPSGSATPSPGAGASGSAGASGGAGPGVDRCHTSELTGRLAPGSPGAGQRYATLTLTDTGGQTCTVYGYGGLGLVAADGHALPTRQVRVASPPPRVVTLRPGQAVSSQLHWGVVAGSADSSSGQCQPTAAALQVIPPDETDHLSIPWHYGPVCQQGEIMQQAYAAA